MEVKAAKSGGPGRANLAAFDDPRRSVGGSWRKQYSDLKGKF